MTEQDSSSNPLRPSSAATSIDGHDSSQTINSNSLSSSVDGTNFNSSSNINANGSPAIHSAIPPRADFNVSLTPVNSTVSLPIAVATPADIESIPLANAQPTAPSSSGPIAVAAAIRGDLNQRPPDQRTNTPATSQDGTISQDKGKKKLSSMERASKWAENNLAFVIGLTLLLIVVAIVVAIVVPLTSSNNSINVSIEALPPPDQKSPPEPPAKLETFATSLCYSGSCSWTQIGSDLYGPSKGDFFGGTVRLAKSDQGYRFSVSAPLYKEASGLTRVYDVAEVNDDSNEIIYRFQQVGQDMIAAYTGDKMEGIICDDGSHLIMSSIHVRRKNEFNVGHVGIFTHQSSSRQWTKTGTSFFGKSSQDEFGRSAVNRDGSVIAISDINFNVQPSAGPIIKHAGAIWVYRWNKNAKVWAQMGQVLTGLSAGQYWGRKFTLSADGFTIAIGSRDFNNGGTEDEDFGLVRVFRLEREQEWVQIGLSIMGVEKEDKMGREVELSADGKVLAVSSSSKWNETGVEGVGIVRIYEYDEGRDYWKQLGRDILSQTPSQLDFGFQLKLSDDGRRIAIGQDKFSPTDDLFEAGRLQVYDYIDNDWVQIGGDIYGEKSCDFVGIGFDLSPDGGRLLVSYPNAEGWGEEGPECAEDGIGEAVRGFVRLYELHENES